MTFEDGTEGQKKGIEEGWLYEEIGKLVVAEVGFSSWDDFGSCISLDSAFALAT